MKARYEGKEYTFTLPKPEEEGYALRLTPRTDRTLQVAFSFLLNTEIQVTEYTLRESFRYSPCPCIRAFIIYIAKTMPKLQVSDYQIRSKKKGCPIMDTLFDFINRQTDIIHFLTACAY